MPICSVAHLEVEKLDVVLQKLLGRVPGEVIGKYRK